MMQKSEEKWNVNEKVIFAQVLLTRGKPCQTTSKTTGLLKIVSCKDFIILVKFSAFLVVK